MSCTMLTLNSLRLREANFRQYNTPSLVQIMSCRSGFRGGTLNTPPYYDFKYDFFYYNDYLRSKHKINNIGKKIIFENIVYEITNNRIRYIYTNILYPPSPIRERPLLPGSTLACHLIGAKPLSELMLPYFQLDPKEHIFVKFYFKLKCFHSRKCTDKCLRNGKPFCFGLNMLNLYGVPSTHIT